MMDQKCITDIECYNYLEGRFTDEEARAVEVHLNSCYSCFEKFASLLRNSLYSANPDEATEISEIRNISVAQQVDKIMSILAAECIRQPRQTPAVIIPILRWWKKLKSIFARSIFAERRWRWAGAVACILIIIGLLGYPEYRNWRSTLFANKAIASLTQLYFITERDSPRPTGGFRFSAIGVTRSRDEVGKIHATKKNLVDALKLDPDNPVIYQYLGTYYLHIEKNIDLASHYYKIAYQMDSTNAAILNDMGCLAIYQKNYEAAIGYLVTAQQHQPELLEAQYNLIIAYSRLGNLAAASQAREKYKELDPAMSWYEISKSLIDTSNPN